ncbi:MAG: ligase-associated DNA damage response endonuclease PdeM [Hyphomicrobiaceae bacterium]
MLEIKPERASINDYATQTITVCGKQFVADMSGALFWPGEKTLIVSDLHLEKASSFAVRGQMLPPYDTRETLQRLAEAIDRYDPARVIALGDSLHEPAAADRIGAEDLQILHILQEDRQWVWVTGNHDREIGDRLGGSVVEAMLIGGLKLQHEPQTSQVTHEIAGHLHPAARLSVYGHTVRRPCFVGNGRRLVVPAFGSLTGGLNVLDPAFEPLFGLDGIRVWMLGQEGVYPVATRQLAAD